MYVCVYVCLVTIKNQADQFISQYSKKNLLDLEIMPIKWRKSIKQFYWRNYLALALTEYRKHKTCTIIERKRQTQIVITNPISLKLCGLSRKCQNDNCHYRLKTVCVLLVILRRFFSLIRKFGISKIVESSRRKSNISVHLKFLTGTTVFSVFEFPSEICLVGMTCWKSVFKCSLFIVSLFGCIGGEREIFSSDV